MVDKWQTIKKTRKKGNITIRKGFSGSQKDGRPDYYIVTNHLGHKLRVGTKAEAKRVAESARRVRAKRRKRLKK